MKRFFAPDSFWNTPIPDNATTDPRSSHCIGLLKNEITGGLGINLTRYTIPVYEVTRDTPRVRVARRTHPGNKHRPPGSWATQPHTFGHGPGFGEAVPIPDHAIPDPQSDLHLAMVDWEEGIAWDMWGCVRQSDGTWAANTGMVYPLNGDGLFRREWFPNLKNGDSVHLHGPSRAPGVPAIAGLIMHDETAAGEINHKLAFACRYGAYQEHVFPAIWTDGGTRGGIPEGAILQLDPTLNLEQFDLLPGEKTVARALQRYGMVNVDMAGGTCLYGEGLWAKPGLSWEGLLRDYSPQGLKSLPIEAFRVLTLGEIIPLGDGRWVHASPF